MIRLSTHVEVTEGTRSDLTDELRAGLLARFQALSADGFRLLAIATRKEPDTQFTVALSDETELTFVGFAVFLDPPKPLQRRPSQHLPPLESR